MPDHILKFGDVIEWDIKEATDVARWFIVHPIRDGYMATWLGGDWRTFGETTHIGWPDGLASWEYRLLNHE
jgi:hypothetical protein